MRNLTREGRVDKLCATEDRSLHGDGITVDRDLGGVGEHGPVELDRQTAQDIAALIALREHDQVRSVSAIDNGFHRG